MPEPSDVRILERLLDEHCEADNRCFASIREDFHNVNTKLDDLMVAVARITTLHEVAKEAGAGAGRRTAQIWSALIAIFVVALDKIMEKLF